MLRTIDIVLVALMVTAAAWTFKIKYEAEGVESDLIAVQHKIQLERETIALLDADWSLLDQPERLQRLAEAFGGDLALQPVRPDQIVEPAELPTRPVEAPPAPRAGSDSFADNSKSIAR